jgi:methylated-DNA-[protein]-cysteine S-methyltransferase
MARKPQSEGRPTGHSLVLGSPLGRLGVCLQDDAISRLDFLSSDTPVHVADNAFARRVADELKHYFTSSSHRFRLAVARTGTPFQQRVWQALREIPPGETRSYGQLAAELGSGARAVGNACRNNPVSIVVPCHRVVAADGLGGYSGRTRGPELRRKSWLLAHEGVLPGVLKNDRAAPIKPRHTESARSSHA